MKALPCLLAACLGLSCGGGARAQDYVYVLSAGEMRGLIDQGKRDTAVGYVSGVMDAMMRTRDFCVPEGVAPASIAVRAYKMMAQQPRDSRAPAADVIGVFLHGDYPCGK